MPPFIEINLVSSVIIICRYIIDVALSQKKVFATSSKTMIV